MLDSLLPLLAVKAKAVGLVAGTALVTSAVVGGGAVVVTTVSAESPVPVTSEQAVPSEDVPLEVTPDPAGAEDPAATATAEQTPPAEETAAPAEEPAAPPVEEPAAPPVEEQAAESEAAAPPHECLPGEWRNHGHYVSTYAKSLPKGPGRGPLVSAAAQSDCGKTAAQVAAEAAEGDAAPADEAEPGKPAKPAKPAKAGVGNGKGQGAANGKGHGKD